MVLKDFYALEKKRQETLEAKKAELEKKQAEHDSAEEKLRQAYMSGESDAVIDRISGDCLTLKYKIDALSQVVDALGGKKNPYFSDADVMSSYREYLGQYERKREAIEAEYNDALKKAYKAFMKLHDIKKAGIQTRKDYNALLMDPHLFETLPGLKGIDPRQAMNAFTELMRQDGLEPNDVLLTLNI